MERAFKGIWIPAEIWLTTELTLQEKVFLVEVDSLDNEAGCYASNNYFSEFFGISKSRISQIVKGLNDKGFITIEYEREGRQIKRRIIKINRTCLENSLGIKYSKQGCLESCTGGSEKTKRGCLENCKENNIDNNNTSNNNTGDKKPVRHKYGEYNNVLLTDADHEKLVDEFPLDYDKRIERLSSYMASTGKTYKNHLATIRNWARRDKEKQTENANSFMGVNF